MTDVGICGDDESLMGDSPDAAADANAGTAAAADAMAVDDVVARVVDEAREAVNQFIMGPEAAKRPICV